MINVESQRIEGKARRRLYLGTFSCPEGHTVERSVISHPGGGVEPAAMPCYTHGRWMYFTGHLKDLRGTDHPGLF